jgi:hypothetical protein
MDIATNNRAAVKCSHNCKGVPLMMVLHWSWHHCCMDEVQECRNPEIIKCYYLKNQLDRFKKRKIYLANMDG